MNLEKTHPRSTENTRQSTPAELDKLQATPSPLDIVSGKLMEDLLSIDPLFIASDDLATTFISAGLVLLTASLLNTRTAERLASSTGLPLKFVKRVIQDMNKADLWNCEQLFDLRSTLLNDGDNPSEVRDSLLCLMEAYWNTRWSEERVRELQRLRRGRLFGGSMQNWIEEPE
jgi:hypothetical protein